MSIKAHIKSFRDIPRVLFDELINHRTVLTKESFRDSCGHPYSVRICFAQKTGENGPHTLVHKSSDMGQGRFHREELMIFDYPIKMSVFNPGYDGWHRPDDSKMSIIFSTDDPPYTNDIAYSRHWERGKGFWVNHFLSLNVNKNVSLISNHGDWEFAFLLHVQRRAWELAKSISCRGHWQADWFPEGNYLDQPNSV